VLWGNGQQQYYNGKPKTMYNHISEPLLNHCGSLAKVQAIGDLQYMLLLLVIEVKDWLDSFVVAQS
jgi:hypothetical protein